MLTQKLTSIGGVAVVAGALCACTSHAPRPQPTPPPSAQEYEFPETRNLVALVDDAARLIEAQGEGAFDALRTPGSRWRQKDTYVFVLDVQGDMIVHPDRALEGKNALRLVDIDGRPIIRGLVHAATGDPSKPEGWYHYQWPEPGQILPRWKSSFVRLVTTPEGRRFVVGSGMYDDRMERAFVVDMVRDAAAEIRNRGEAAFPLFHDRTGPFLAKDAYIFVVDPRGVELVNPAFPNLEGRNLSAMHDSHGKPLVQEMLGVAQTRGSGWVDYMWPRPGESASTRKSTYVTRVDLDGRWLLVGAGVYLPGALKEAPEIRQPTAPELVQLVREAAIQLEQRGEDAFPDFRQRGSRWFHDDTYFVIWTMDGTRMFHAADPSLEGKPIRDVRDIQGRPYGRMILDAARSRSGEGWIHYMFPEPDNVFPVWKSTFVKRVTFPSGVQRIIGAGIYNMDMDKSFIVDVVDRAADLIAARGEAAFDEIRDRTGPFVFMDTYVFVDRPDGTELVNPAQPSFEGQNVADLRDIRGEPVARRYIAAAQRHGNAWVQYWWYKPGTNLMARKQAYVRTVRFGPDTYIVGSGLYLDR